MDHRGNEDCVALGARQTGRGTSVDGDSPPRNCHSRVAAAGGAEWWNIGQHKRVDARFHAKAVLFLRRPSEDAEGMARCLKARSRALMQPRSSTNQKPVEVLLSNVNA